jgi:hypothetical protein
MNTNFTEGNEGNEDLTESLQDRIIGKATSENFAPVEETFMDGSSNGR